MDVYDFVANQLKRAVEYVEKETGIGADDGVIPYVQQIAEDFRSQSVDSKVLVGPFGEYKTICHQVFQFAIPDTTDATWTKYCELREAMETAVAEQDFVYAAECRDAKNELREKFGDLFASDLQISPKVIFDTMAALGFEPPDPVS